MAAGGHDRDPAPSGAAPAGERERTARVWALGDYDRVAERLEPAAAALVAAAAVRAGTRVLDVAAGTGNVAMAAAHAGARAVAADISPAMVAHGRTRTAGLEIDWHEADVQDLPFEDAGFDAVLSCFGAIFAPDAERAAAEMLRVAGPGAPVALTAWEDSGMQAVLNGVVDRHFPAAPTAPLQRWSTAEAAREVFEHAGATTIDVARRMLRWTFAGLDDWLAFWDEAAPPFVAARRALGEDAWREVRRELAEGIAPHADTTGGRFVLEPAYLLVVARRR